MGGDGLEPPTPCV